MNPVLEHIPTPGLITVSPRFVASVGAAVTCGLLGLLWAYRRRAFILIWAAGWASVSTAMFVVSDADPAGAISPIRLAVGGSAAVSSCMLFLAGVLRHRRPVRWPALLVVPGVAFAVYAATSGFVPPGALFALTMLAMAGVLGTAAVHVGGIARARGMLGGAVLAAAFGAVVLCNIAAAAAAIVSSIDLVLARVVLFANAAAYVLVAFGQQLFVFEDMLLELKDSNRSLETARAEIQLSAITDALTGLYNRRLFNEVAAHQLEHHRRFHLPLSLLYIDVDRFKVVNDTLGHDVGDRVLKHVAIYISRQVREADYVFRLGGDEFLVLISCDQSEAARKAQELQAGFSPTLASSGLPAELGLSVGVAEVPSDTRDILASIQEADTRMYQDKRRRAALAISLAVLVMAGSRPSAQSRPLVAPAAAEIYQRLLPQISRIRIFDHHAHPGFADDPEVDPAPVPPSTSPFRLREENPDWVASARALFAFPFSDLQGAHGKWLADRKAALRRSQPGARYFSAILDRLGIETSVANRITMSDALDPARFKWVFYIDPVLFPFDNSGLAARNPDEAAFMPNQTKLVQRFQHQVGPSAPPASLADYLTFVSRVLEDHQRRGAIAAKFEIAYFRSFVFDDPPRDLVAAIYDQYRRGGTPSGQEYKAFQDFVFRWVLTECARLRLPVHIHSSAGAGDYFSISGGNVLNLENMLRDPRYGATTFVLIHGGHPFEHQAIWLASMKNVWLDSSATGSFILFPDELKRVLRVWLASYPDKITFGSDAFPMDDRLGVEELYWFGVHNARTALAAALAEMIAAREITEPQALGFAHGYLHDNAAALYK